MSEAPGQPSAGADSAGRSGSESTQTPLPARPFFDRSDWLSFGITAVLALVVYLTTLAPETTLEFSGILSTSAKYAGVAQPPGFPVWTLYSWFFTRLLPFSNIAWRVAVGSAVAAALACGLVALMVSRGARMLWENGPSFSSLKPEEQKLLKLVSSCVAGMGLGLSGTVWREAVVAEIWALTTLLFAIMLCLLMRWTGEADRRRFLYLALLFFGLVLSGNLELILLTPGFLLVVILADQRLGRDLALPISLLAIVDWWVPRLGGYVPFLSYMDGNPALLLAFSLVAIASVFIIVRTRRFGTEWKAALVCGVVLLLGLTCCFYLPITSMTNPPSNWGYPRTVEGFFHLITRGQYERPHPTHDLVQYLGQIGLLAEETWKGLGWPYLVAATLPILLWRGTSRCGLRWLLGLLGIFMCAGPLMIALLNPAADRSIVDLIRPFFAAMDFVLVVWAGLGLVAFGSVVLKWQKR